MSRDFNYYCRICLSYCILKDNGLENLKIVLKNTYLYTLRLESGYYQVISQLVSGLYQLSDKYLEKYPRGFITELQRVIC